MSPYLNGNWIFLGRGKSLWQKRLFDFIQSTLSAQSRTYFEDLRSSFRMKSVCSGPYQVTLQASPVVILEPALMFFMNIYLLQLQMWISCIAACIHSRILTLWKAICLCLPCTLPQAATRAPSLPCWRLSNPSSHSLSWSILCSCPAQPVSHCWAPSSTPALLSSTGEPKLGAVLQVQPLQRQGMGRDCCPQHYSSGELNSTGLSGPGYNLVVLPRHILNSSKSKNYFRNC